VRALYGRDARTAWITYAVVAAQLALACALGRAARAGHWAGSLPALVLVAYAVGAFAAKWSGVAIHESAHNLVYRTTRQNMLFALIANLPVLVPSAASFRRYHRDHHSHMGVAGMDNDLPSRWELRVVGTSAWRKAVWLVLYVFVGTLARGFVRRPNRAEVVNALVQLAADIAIVLLLGWTAFLYLALSTFFGFGPHPVAGHFIHEHYLWQGTQESWSYYGPLNRVTLNLGYHNEHHDFPRVPSARLPALHALAAGHYDALASHTSWTAVMLHFVRSPALGHHARLARSLAAVRRARHAGM
jgi:sphingolipid delta-4 desaturase